MSQKLTEKDVYSLAGEVGAACLIMNNVMQEMCSGRWKVSEDALKAVMEAVKVTESLRTALRKVSYEVENVRQDSGNNK